MAVAALFVAVLAVGIDSPPVGTTAEAWRLCTTGVLACPGIAGTITSTIAASAGVRGMQVPLYHSACCHSTTLPAALFAFGVPRWPPV